MANLQARKLSSEKIIKMYQKLDPLLYYVRGNFPANDSWAFSELIYKTYFIPDCKKNVQEIFKRVAPKVEHHDASETGSYDNTVDFDTTCIQGAIQRLNDCLTDENCQKLTEIFERQDLSENEMLVGCGVHLIKKLTGNGYTNSSKGNLVCPCGCGEKLEKTDMCIGTSNTWHGELDLLAGHKATNIAVKLPDDISDNEEMDDNEEFQSSPGDGTNSENSIYAGEGLCEVIAESIVFAWTEHNRHPDYHSCIPTILITKGKFAAFIYNPVNDELYATAGYQNLNPKDDRFSGIFCLWVFLNHRLFFRKENNKDSRRMCSFNTSLSEDKLVKYKSLREYYKRVNVSKEENELCLYPNMECLNWYL